MLGPLTLSRAAEGNQPSMARKLSTTETQKLLDGIRLGDRDAERQLFSAFEGLLRADARQHPLMAVVRRRHSEEDVVHEVWLRFCGSGSFLRFEHRGPGSLRRFLGIMLDRALVDLVRHDQADRRGGSLDVRSLDDGHHDGRELQHATDDPTPTSRSRSAELRRLCRRILEPREYEIWRMVEVEERAAVEVAAEMCTSSASIRGIVHRARLKLLKQLDARLSER